MALATYELVRIKQLFQELKFCEVELVVILWKSNNPLYSLQSMISLEYQMYIEINCHFVREKLLS